MFSRIITVIFAVHVVSVANGFINSKLKVLEPILKCYEGNDPEFADEAARVNSDADYLKLSCKEMREYASCLADVLEKTPSPVPKVFLFYGAEAYQTSFLLKRANVCPGIKYDDLKRIVLSSGIMKKEKLSNIEGDDYYKCAGDAMGKCLIESIQQYKHESEEPDAGVDAYIDCIEEQAKTCNHDIMHHLFEQIEAYKKHVKQLEELESEEQEG